MRSHDPVEEPHHVPCIAFATVFDGGENGCYAEALDFRRCGLAARLRRIDNKAFA